VGQGLGMGEAEGGDAAGAVAGGEGAGVWWCVS